MKPRSALTAVTAVGRDLLVDSGEGAMQLWDPWTRKEHSVLPGHQDWVYTVCGDANGHVPLASGGGSTVQLQDRVPVGNTNAATICQG
jgi:WD40 repeat protein